MDHQTDLDVIIRNLYHGRETERCITAIHQLYKSTELRDYNWVVDCQNDQRLKLAVSDSPIDSRNGSNVNADASPAITSYDLYTSIWKAIIFIWGSSQQNNNSNSSGSANTISCNYSSESLESQYYLLEVWNFMITLPECDHIFASHIYLFDEIFINDLYMHIALMATTYIPSKAKYAVIILQYLKNTLHWLYLHRIASRPYMRSMLYKYFFPVEHNMRLTGSSSNNDHNEAFKSSLRGYSHIKPNQPLPVTDSGSSKAHLSHLLDFLHTIISGLSITDPAQRSTHSESITDGTIDDMDGVDAWRDYRLVTHGYKHLLASIILPLHTPNEMVQWRDQIPVLQTYHESLVRCLLRLIDRDEQALKALIERIGDDQLVRDLWCVKNSHKSIIVQAVEGLLHQWPDRFDTNTPKQVLLLHELEMLLNKMSPEDFQLVKTPLLVS